MTKLLLSAAVFGLFPAAHANAVETMKCDDGQGEVAVAISRSPSTL